MRAGWGGFDDASAVSLTAAGVLANVVPGTLPLEPLTERAGKLQVPDKPGLGITVDEQALESLATAHWIIRRED